MANPMPLVHQARRTIHNRHERNPFATDAVIAELIEALDGSLPHGGKRLHLTHRQS